MIKLEFQDGSFLLFDSMVEAERSVRFRDGCVFERVRIGCHWQWVAA